MISPPRPRASVDRRVRGVANRKQVWEVNNGHRRPSQHASETGSFRPLLVGWLGWLAGWLACWLVWFVGLPVGLFGSLARVVAHWFPTLYRGIASFASLKSDTLSVFPALPTHACACERA